MAAYNDLESAIKKFTNNGNPYYALYVNGVKIDTNSVLDDIEEASEKLRDDLSPYKNSKNSWDDKIVVYCFNDKHAATKLSANEIKNKCTAAITIRFPDVRDRDNSNNGSSREIIEILTIMRNDLNVQKEKLASLQAELESDEDDEDDDFDSNPIIGSLKRNPEVMDNIVNMAATAIGKIFVKNPVNAIGSVNLDDNSIENSISILEAADPKLNEHLAILADMATNNPSQFNFLISMLK
jgi:hypothetical protein